MIINQKHKPEQIFEFAADILRGMVPSGVIVIDQTRQQILTLSPTNRSMGQVKVPCHLIIEYRDTRPPPRSRLLRLRNRDRRPRRVPAVREVPSMQRCPRRRRAGRSDPGDAEGRRHVVPMRGPRQSRTPWVGSVSAERRRHVTVVLYLKMVVATGVAVGVGLWVYDGIRCAARYRLAPLTLEARMYVFVLILILINDAAAPPLDKRIVRYESPPYPTHALCVTAREAVLKDLAQRDDINGLYMEPCTLKL